VDVPGGHRGHAESPGQLGEQPIAAPVVAPERALDLDAEAIRAEDAGEAAGDRRRIRVTIRLHERGDRAVAGAARQADEAGGVLLELRQGDARLAVERILAPSALLEALARPAAGGPVRGREQAAEVRVALARLA
jgi:hypothetical protein